MNDVSERIAARPQLGGLFKIKPLAVKRSGRNARRAAFYHRARLCRILTRIALSGFEAQEKELQARFWDAVVCGANNLDWFDPKTTDAE